MGRLSKIAVTAMLIITATLSGATRHEAKAFPATHESVPLENEAADRAGLKRYLSADDVAKDVSSGVLVPIAWVAVSPKLPRERRYLRPAAADFVGWLDFEFYYEKGKHLVVDSAVRSADVQQRLGHINRSAAPAIGARASSHERGTTFDLSRHMRRGEYRWLLTRLAYYRALGRILVIEEKSCIHICVREDQNL
jgi:hypothetical protein